ncbi:hypothetical protein BGV68_13240 [Burkholderia ubonensis]|nr:hypothetical protein BGV68_13240 [Burkholderia ubonensis]
MQAGAGFLRFFLDAFEFLKKQPRLAEEAPAGVGQLQRAPALEQRAAETLLALLDALADDRLGRAEAARGFGKAARLDDGHESAHIGELVHCILRGGIAGRTGGLQRRITATPSVP